MHNSPKSKLLNNTPPHAPKSKKVVINVLKEKHIPEQGSGFVGDDEVDESLSIGEETYGDGGVIGVGNYLSRNVPI